MHHAMQGSSSSIPAFVTLVAVAVTLGGLTAITRRADTKHRSRLTALGMKENDKNHRLRADLYKRIALLSYMVFGCFFLYLAPANNAFGYGREADLLGQTVVILAVSLGAAIPALIVWRVVRYLTELFIPWGERFKTLFYGQWHKPMTTGGAPAASDIHGSTRVAEAWQLGMTTNWGKKGFVPINPEGDL